MPHFYILPEDIGLDTIVISGGEVHHILDVLHRKTGDKLDLFDGMGNEYKVEISAVRGTDRKREIVTRIISTRKSLSEPGVKIALYQSIPKSGKMDMIVRKCTEIGVCRFVPVISERTVVRLDAKKKQAKARRWQEIAKNAAQQSGRGIVPVVEEVRSLSDALKACAGSNSSRIILWESERKESLRSYISENCDKNSNVSILVGPEGGFSHGEVAEAESSGFSRVSIGSRILRTETAGLVTAAIILYETNNL